MTHVAHSHGLRLGFTKDWKSRWFTRRNFKQLLKQDLVLREWLFKKLRAFFVESIIIERSATKMTLILRTSRPGFIIGRGGAGVEKLKKDIYVFLKKNFGESVSDFSITIEEIRAPELYARLVALSIAESLEKRMQFRRVIKQALIKTKSSREAMGVRIALSGRLDGSEMARHEWLQEGSVPLQKLTADIDFARERARLPYGDIGIKVWIHRKLLETKE